MGICCSSSFSCCTAHPEFEFESQSEIVQYRIRIGDEIFWTGTDAKEFKDKIPSALQKYREKILMSMLGGKAGMVFLERFYGASIPESEQEGLKGPTKNCDIYLIDYQPRNVYHAGCMLSASQVRNSRIRKFILCYESEPQLVERLDTDVLRYLSQKEF